MNIGSRDSTGVYLMCVYVLDLRTFMLKISCIIVFCFNAFSVLRSWHPHNNALVHTSIIHNARQTHQTTISHIDSPINWNTKRIQAGGHAHTAGLVDHCETGTVVQRRQRFSRVPRSKQSPLSSQQHSARCAHSFEI